MAVPLSVVRDMVPIGVVDTSVDRTPYTSKASTSEKRRVYFYVYADASGAQTSVPTLQNDVGLGVRDGQWCAQPARERPRCGHEAGTTTQLHTALESRPVLPGRLLC